MKARQFIDQVSKGQLGEAGGYGELYGDLWAEMDVTFRVADRRPGDTLRLGKLRHVSFPVRIRLNRHVDWDDAERWAQSWVASTSDLGARALGSSADIVVVNPRDEEELQAIRPWGYDMALFQHVGPVRWVHHDGTPYDTRPLHRWNVKRHLDGGPALEGRHDEVSRLV